LLLLLAIPAVCGAPLGRAQTTPRRIEITAKRFAYTPNEITLKKDEPVVLVLRSKDVTHGFEIPDLNIKAEIKKGKNTEIKFTPTVAGQFEGRCAFFCGAGHGTMTFHITVLK
jgi:cytochrome c oxidase subunit 2